MYQGEIKLVNKDKGYGFLEIDGIDHDVFFHATGLDRKLTINALQQGDKVVVSNIKTTERGDAAVGISLAD